MGAIKGSLNTALFLPRSKWGESLFGIYQSFYYDSRFYKATAKRLHTPALEVTNWIKIRRVDNRSPLQSFLYLLRKKSPLASSYYHPTISLPKQIFLNPRNVETLSKHQNSNLIMVQINSAANSKLHRCSLLPNPYAFSIAPNLGQSKHETKWEYVCQSVGVEKL